jgi:alpha-tubulin suppressor-like RCC1 family protein
MRPSTSPRKRSMDAPIKMRGGLGHAAVGLLIVLGLVLGCTDSQAPSVSDTGPSPFLVSSPVPDPSPSSSVAGTGRLSATAVYVSLPPGTIPNGINATIRDLRTDSRVTVGVVNGGFDPVALPALVGDTLAMAVQTAGGGSPSYLSVVAGAKRPTVVRTDPPSHKRDVPLNGLIVIVFSEPIDPATLTGSTVQLKQGTTLVPGQLAFADVVHLRATFTPSALLDGATDYELTISQGITDVNGLVLDSAITVPFTTGTLPPPSGLVFTSLSAGSFHSCGVSTSGAAYCWGENSTGALGNGTTTSSATPVPVEGGLTFAAVSAGYTYTCGVTNAGALYCWGNAAWSSMGTSPLPLAPGLTFASVSAGNSHMCGVTTTGAAYCWGIDFSGEIGGGGGNAVLGGLSFAAVHAGDGDDTCGVTTTGAAYCWGDNSNGELGTGSTTGPEVCTDWPTNPPRTWPCSRVPVAVAGGLTLGQVGDGQDHACGLTSSGSAYCWGANYLDQLGNGTTTGPDMCWSHGTCAASPVPVAGGLTFASVSAGPFHTCGVTTTGAGYCWGGPWLGDGTTTSSATPVAIAGGLTFAEMSSGGDAGGFTNTCGVTTSGAAYCWGNNQYGQLGDGTATNSPVPVKVAGQP